MQKRDVKEFVRLTKWTITFFKKCKPRMWTIEQIPVAQSPRNDDALSWLATKRIRSTLDIRWGYHNLMLDQQAQQVMTFTTQLGSLQKIYPRYKYVRGEFLSPSHTLPDPAGEKLCRLQSPRSGGVPLWCTGEGSHLSKS